MREISERLDKDVNILPYYAELLQGINDNFNTLPERIAEAIVKR